MRKLLIMWMSRVKKYGYLLEGSEVLLVSLLALVVLELLVGKPLSRFPAYVDWNTIVTLTGLLLITTAIKESRFFYWLAYRISARITNERNLALFLVTASAILAMFLTNDIALFIIVPLTLSLQKISGSNYIKFIVFEAIAVNAGSTFTGIGNPQNIHLWHQWQISFPLFSLKMLPLEGILLFWLLIGTIWVFPAKKIHSDSRQKEKVNRSLFWSSVFIFILFLISAELHYDAYLLAILFVYYSITKKTVIKNADWKLILLFVIIFIDVHLLYRLDLVNRFMESLNLKNTYTLFASGVFLSQIISNVPATLLLLKYSDSFKVITLAVNVGGNGLLIASFANIIALHFARNPKKYLYFHRYSLLYLLVTSVSVFILLI